MVIPNHLICLLRNLNSGYEATVRTTHGKMDWSNLEKEYVKAILSPCLFKLYEECIMGNARLHETHAESRLWGEISITSAIQMVPP